MILNGSSYIPAMLSLLSVQSQTSLKGKHSSSYDWTHPNTFF